MCSVTLQTIFSLLWSICTVEFTFWSFVPSEDFTWAMRKNTWLFRLCWGFYPVLWGLFKQHIIRIPIKQRPFFSWLTGSLHRQSRHYYHPQWPQLWPWCFVLSLDLGMVWWDGGWPTVGYGNPVIYCTWYSRRLSHRITNGFVWCPKDLKVLVYVVFFWIMKSITNWRCNTTYITSHPQWFKSEDWMPISAGNLLWIAKVPGDFWRGILGGWMFTYFRMINGKSCRLQTQKMQWGLIGNAKSGEDLERLISWNGK